MDMQHIRRIDKLDSQTIEVIMPDKTRWHISALHIYQLIHSKCPTETKNFIDDIDKHGVSSIIQWMEKLQWSELKYFAKRAGYFEPDYELGFKFSEKKLV